MAINPGDFFYTGNSGLTTSYYCICQLNKDGSHKVCSAKKSDIQFLDNPGKWTGKDVVVRSALDRIEIGLTDSTFIGILKTQVIRKDMKAEFGEWLTKKLLEICGEQILSSKDDTIETVKQNAPAPQIIESNESLGFIHIR